MKVLVTDYSFNASSKTVTFNSYTNIELNRLLLITNATRNTIIYNFANPTLGGTIAGNILTLATSTAGMSSDDKLQIFYENEDTPATDQMITLLNRIVASLRGAQNVDSSDRLRMTLDAITITPTVNANSNTDLVTLFSVANMREMMYILDRTNFGSSIRPLIQN